MVIYIKNTSFAFDSINANGEEMSQDSDFFLWTVKDGSESVQHGDSFLND